MKTSTNNTISSRCTERQILANQVAEFLKLGGRITIVDGLKKHIDVKIKGSVWQSSELQ